MGTKRITERKCPDCMETKEIAHFRIGERRSHYCAACRSKPKEERRMRYKRSKDDPIGINYVERPIKITPEIAEREAVMFAGMAEQNYRETRRGSEIIFS